MGQLIIQRKKSIYGSALQLTCFADDQLICKIKNGEEMTCSVEDRVIDFKCSLSKNSMSDVVSIDTRSSDNIRILLKPGIRNPQVIVMDQDAIVAVKSSSSTNVSFSPTKTVGSYFGIDENTKKWAIGKGLIHSFRNSTLYDYEDIIDFELIEDGTSLVKGNLGHAAVGGLLFGGIGAIVGGITGEKKIRQKCTNLIIKITVNNMDAPVEYIQLITSSVNKNSYAYTTAFSNAQEIISLLQVICSQREDKAWGENTDTTILKISVADELRKLKALMDDGIITEEEFCEKKNRLLNM